MLVCVAGAEQIENMTPRDESGLPCEARNPWRRKKDTAQWFHTFLFEVRAVRCQTRGIKCNKKLSAVLSNSNMRGAM